MTPGEERLTIRLADMRSKVGEIAGFCAGIARDMGREDIAREITRRYAIASCRDAVAARAEVSP
jgi:hypothetical protein